MRQLRSAGWALAALLAVFPTAAFAELYKCVSPDGTSSFSDKPCADKQGQKPADINPDSSLSTALARERDRAVGQACSELADRARQCRLNLYNVSTTIQQHFTEGCADPERRYEVDRIKASRNRYAQPDYDRVYTYHQKTMAELKCDVLVTDIWQFVKDKFSKSLTEKEIKAVDYQTQAVEPNQQSTPNQQQNRPKTTVVIIRTSQ